MGTRVKHDQIEMEQKLYLGAAWRRSDIYYSHVVYDWSVCADRMINTMGMPLSGAARRFLTGASRQRLQALVH